MTQILAGHHKLDAAAVLADTAAFRERLADAKRQHGHALCLCVSPARRLVIRERGGALHLAVWPDDGQAHAPACPFYREPHDQTGLRAYEGRAVIESEDGFQIEPAFQLARPLAARREAPAAEHPARSRLPLLGTLHYLWSTARLNRWGRGWRRDYWRAHREVTTAAASGRLGSLPLSKLLFMPPPFRQDRAAEINEAWSDFLAPLRQQPGDTQVRSGLLLAQISAFERSPQGFLFRLRHHAEQVHVDEQVHGQLVRRHLRALSAVNGWRDGGHLVIGLLQVELTTHGRLRLVDAALMLTTPHFVPFDSTYEARVAMLLVEHNRTFVKPLDFDADGEMLPDFILLDTPQPTFMEVFSLETADYLRMRDEKIRLCKESGRPLWMWDPTLEHRVPAFPSCT